MLDAFDEAIDQAPWVRDRVEYACQPLVEGLSPDLRRVAALRARVAELKTIADEQQVAISTAHQRVTTAMKRIRRQVRRRRVGPDMLRRVLTVIAE